MGSAVTDQQMDITAFAFDLICFSNSEGEPRPPKLLVSAGDSYHEVTDLKSIDWLISAAEELPATLRAWRDEIAQGQKGPQAENIVRG